MLFTIRCLHKHQKVVERHVEAVDFAQAVQIGQEGCKQSIGEYTYIGTDPFLTWDASILPAVVDPEPELATAGGEKRKGRIGA